MVVALGPGRFYGGGLPRPRVFPGDRVDPPAPVTDALLCWARDAHWSMGGLGAKRLRLQGRIEGNLVKLRRTARRDARVSAKDAKASKAKVRAAGHRPAPATLDDALGSDDDDDSEDEAEVAAQERALRREVVDDDEDSESGESEGEGVPLVTIAAAAKRKRVRKLSDEFDRIAAAQLEGGGKKKPVAAAPGKAPLKKKAAAAAAPAPAAEAPAKKSLKRKAVAPAAGAPAERTSPKRKAAEAPASRRTSPRSKH